LPLSPLHSVPHSPLSILHSRITSHCFFFSNDTPTTEIYTLSLHDALPISHAQGRGTAGGQLGSGQGEGLSAQQSVHDERGSGPRSEEHTSELQSLTNLVCRLLLEKKKKHNKSVGVRLYSIDACTHYSSATI